jgi:uncharacterized protein (TIGR02172 family)
VWAGAAEGGNGEDSVMVGVGNTAEVFDFGEGKVCKLFRKGYPKESVEREFRNAKEVQRLGLPVPKVFELVETEGRTGIVYEKIDGKSMLECIVENPGKAGFFLEEFVRLQKKWLKEASVHAASILSYKEFLQMLTNSAGQKTEASLLEEINALPEGDTVLHGDFQPGNVLILTDNCPVVIDFMNVCRGPALYDIARTYFLLKEKDEAFGRVYLEQMEVTHGDISLFLNVLERCRMYER